LSARNGGSDGREEDFPRAAGLNGTLLREQKVRTERAQEGRQRTANARIRFAITSGRGIHPQARLNLGDCAVYALAKGMNAPRCVTSALAAAVGDRRCFSRRFCHRSDSRDSRIILLSRFFRCSIAR
jgi:hypothetical protein